MQKAQPLLASIDLQPIMQRPDARLQVGFSGGLDSTVLLHLLAQHFPDRLRALHVHHGLQTVADDWARHCEAVCADLAVPFERIDVQIDPTDPAGPEAAARRERYNALRSRLAAGDGLVTAHHRDDQAETVLLRLLRGTGVHGLAGMRQVAEFAPGWIWRPLLAIPRNELQAYAQSQGLRWIEDPHNVEPRYARSWLRTQVIPQLQPRFPQVSRSLARTAQLAAEACELLDQLASQDLVEVAAGAALQVEPLLQLGSARRHNLLRYWLRGQGFEVPPANELTRIAGEVLAAAVDAEPRFAWSGCELRRFRGLLFVMAPLAAVPLDWSMDWRDGATLQLPAGCGELHAAHPPQGGLRLRFPRAGESFRPAGAAHQRTLKNLFQEAGVPPWARRRLPVIESAGEILAVAGLGHAQAWEAQRADTIGALEWRHSLAGLRSPLAL